jgi:hypothetical protein
MPKIEVYKGAGNVIPICEAKKTKAYQCPWTKQVYLTKKSYVSHLKDLRETRMHKRAREIVDNKIKQDLWNQPTFNDIINWISLHPEFIFNRLLKHSFMSDRKKLEESRDTFSINITYLKLMWNERCSNTHTCPHNGVTNWGGRTVLKDKSPAPRGYPGWTGSIEFKVKYSSSFETRVLKELRINAGSGGGSSNGHYRYSVILFAEDWPELYKIHKDNVTEKILLDLKEIPDTYKFEYGKSK